MMRKDQRKHCGVCENRINKRETGGNLRKKGQMREREREREIT